MFFIIFLPSSVFPGKLRWCSLRLYTQTTDILPK